MTLQKQLFRLTILIALGFPLVACRRDPGFRRPNGVVQASDGSLYVMDSGNHRVVHITQDGKVLASFGSLGDKPEQIWHGWDIDLDKEGNVYICNIVGDDERTRHDGVKVFSPTGQFRREIGPKDYPEDSTTPPNKPYGLDIDDAGRLYVADYGTGVMRVFDTQGRSLAILFGNTKEETIFVGLNDIAVDDTRGLLYIVDFDGNRVVQYRLSFDSSGTPTVTYQMTIATYGQEAGQVAFPQYITVDDLSGLVYVGDLANRRIQVFDSQGAYVSQFTAPNVHDWQILGVSLGKDGNIYVADAFNNIIWGFATDGMLRYRIEVKR